MTQSQRVQTRSLGPIHPSRTSWRWYWMSEGLFPSGWVEARDKIFLKALPLVTYFL